MATRRGFFGQLAALAAAVVLPKPAIATPIELNRAQILGLIRATHELFAAQRYPNIEQLIRADVAKALARGIDKEFIDSYGDDDQTT